MALTSGSTGGGFAKVRDLSDANDRAAVLEAVVSGMPEAQEATARNVTAQLWALRGRIEVGDLVVMPLKNSPYLAIGRITGDFQYLATEPDPARRHMRPVEWRPLTCRARWSNRICCTPLGAFSTICEMSRNDAAWRLGELMAGKPDPGARPGATKIVTRTDASDEASDTAQSEIDVETYTRDRITSRVIENFAGHRLADLVAAILNAKGYACEVSPEGTDQGVDIIAGTGALGLSSPKVIVQVKSEAGTVGLPVVQQLQGAISTHRADHGLLVAWGGITRDAKRYLSTQRFTIRVWDSEDVLNGLFEHYHQLPAALTRDILLKQVWTLAEETG